MIDVHARPVAAPFQMGHGERASSTAFSRFLESSAPNRNDEPAEAMRPPREESPLQCDESLQNDGCNGQDVGLVADGRNEIVAEAGSGGNSADSSPGFELSDEAAWLSIIHVDQGNRLAGPQYGGEGRAWDSAIDCDGLMPVQDATHLRMHAPGGEEWVFRPWRLHAGSGLSYRGGNGLSCLMDGSGALGLALQAGAGKSSGVFVDAFIEGGSPALRESQPAFSLHGDTVIRSGGGNGADPSDPGACGGRRTGAWVHWSQRMLRWNAGAMDDDGTTAWVRDFFLESDEVPVLVASLRAFSAGQGMSLSRIMINGREAWAAAGYSQHMERGRDGC